MDTLTLLAVAAFDFGPVLGEGTFLGEVTLFVTVAASEVRWILWLRAFGSFVALLTVCC